MASRPGCLVRFSVLQYPGFVSPGLCAAGGIGFDGMAALRSLCPDGKDGELIKHDFIEDASCPLVSLKRDGKHSVIRLGGVTIGGGDFTIMAGPCSVENEKQIMDTAGLVAAAGCRILRGGVFKPRTSPYSFQGLGRDGLDLLRKAADAYGLLVVTEVMDSEDIDAVAASADIVQIGSRNMMSYSLLKKVGRIGKPVLLKRNMSARLDDFLLAAEYLMLEGCKDVILCERGVVTFDPAATRNILDLAAVPLLKSRTHLPVIVDPSHATGRRSLVGPMSLAALSVGADGLLIEVHPSPGEALCDGRQSLFFRQFEELCDRLNAMKKFLDNYKRQKKTD